MWLTYLLYAIGILAALFVLLVVVVSLRPSQFCVRRSKTMAVPPATVFPHVNDLHRWEAWSPWAKLDPQMKKEYAGAEAGQGAIYRWNGNGNVGEVQTTITESQPNEQVRIELQFKRPFQGTNQVEFTFQPRGSETEVVWQMTGTYGFMAKAFGLLMNMDNMIGGQFDQGLTELKSIVEKQT